MRRPSIGTHVIDTSRRHLGVGVLQIWFTLPHMGLVARVKFAEGLRLVRWDDCVSRGKVCQ